MMRAKTKAVETELERRAGAGRKDGLGNQLFGLKYKKERKTGVDFKFLVQVLGK